MKTPVVFASLFLFLTSGQAVAQIRPYQAEVFADVGGLAWAVTKVPSEMDRFSSGGTSTVFRSADTNLAWGGGEV